jgi:hypothetical protein
MIGRLRTVWRDHHRQALVPILLVVAALNLAVTPFLPEHAQPVKWHAEPDLGRLVFEERPSVALRFGVYERLREVASGGTLIVPTDGVLDPHVARGLANVTVDVADYDAQIDTDDLPVASRGLYDGTGQSLEYLVLQGSGDVWWEGSDAGRIVLVPASLIPVPEPRDG